MLCKSCLFFIFILSGFYSCKNKAYSSVFDYDFKTKSELMKNGFEVFREDNRKMKKLRKEHGTYSHIIPDEDVWDGWLIKKIEDTVVSFVFKREKLSHSIIKIIKTVRILLLYSTILENKGSR